MIFIADLVLNLLILGPVNVWKEKKYIYIELVLQLLSLVYVIVIFTGHYTSSKDGYLADISLLFLLRNGRAIFFAIEIKSIRLIMETTRKISKPILGKFLFIYLIFYVYA